MRARAGRRQFLALAALGATGCAAVQELEPSADAGGALHRIALVSCTDQTQPQPIWDAIMDARPGLVLFGGDNVYASEPPWSVRRLQQAYERQAKVPGFARLREAVPHLAIWDDHDCGLNDGGAAFEGKQASKDAFLQFWGVPADDPRRTREGLQHAQVFGPPGRRVQVIVLDTRWFRSPLKPTDARNAPGRERYLPDDDPAKTMLGEAQWQWLESQLRRPAELRLLLSSIQVLAEGHGWERWGNLPRERERLFQTVARTGANGVVFLSGDRHVGALYRHAQGTPYPLHELTSSGVTHAWREASEPGPNRLGELVVENHFGLVDIDWLARRLSLALHDVGGQVQRRHAIAFHELNIAS